MEWRLMMFELTGNVAIVTGTASKIGIGRATAIALSQQGAHLAQCDVDGSGLKEVEEIIRSMGNEVISFEADVSSAEDVGRIVDGTLKQFGRIDILVNNAAINQPIKVVDMSEEDWERVLSVNLKSVFLFCRAVLPSMMKQHYGRIINLSSVAGKTGCISYGGAH
jgi:3-oxoacyl-[acyl-carrier protein] reductase